MKLLVCGGRDYSDAKRVGEVLRNVLTKWGNGEFRPRDHLIIEGGAMGADRLARLWAVENGVHVATVHALWNSYGRAAGGWRNSTMLWLQPDQVLAFPGGVGTRDMKLKARAVGLRVIEITGDT